MKCALAWLLTLTALLAPLRSLAGGFGLPPPVPFSQLLLSEVIIAPAGTPWPVGYPCGLTPEFVAQCSEDYRLQWGILLGYTIPAIYTTRPIVPPLPAWLLVPISASSVPTSPAPALTPLSEITCSHLKIRVPTAPAPGDPFIYSLTWKNVAVLPANQRHWLGIPDGYTIESVYSDIPFSGPVPPWTLLPIPPGSALAAWLLTHPGVTPPDWMVPVYGATFAPAP